MQNLSKQQPLASPFHRDSTAEEVAQGVDLTGKRAIVTGATAGLGLETARVLALRGAQVTLLGRNEASGEAIAAKMQQETGNPHIEMVSVDLKSTASVNKFTQHMLEAGQPLDLLINNAGVMASPYQRCEFGYESQLFINYVGHLLLSTALVPLLLKSSAARVVSLTSLGHHMSPVVLDDLNFEEREYDKWRAYGQSKTATSLLGVYLHERLGEHGIISTAVHPGSIAETNLDRYLSPEEQQAARSAGSQSVWKTLPQGAATTVWAASSPLLDGRGGTYLEDCNVAAVVEKPNFKYGVMPYAVCADTATKLAHQVAADIGLQLP